jgi:hypothetical protein
MVDWIATWNWMRVELQRVEDERDRFDHAFAAASKSSLLDKATASVEYARALCRFLSRTREHGVFDAILESVGHQDPVRAQLLQRLGEFLREEEILLERARLKPEVLGDIMKDMRAVTRPPYPSVPKDLWDKHLQQAIDTACHFPKSGVLLAARNMADYVMETRKKHKWVYVAVVGTVDGLSAAVDPTVIGTAKVSAYVAALMGIGQKGEGGGDPPPGFYA